MPIEKSTPTFRKSLPTLTIDNDNVESIALTTSNNFLSTRYLITIAENKEDNDFQTERDPRQGNQLEIIIKTNWKEMGPMVIAFIKQKKLNIQKNINQNFKQLLRNTDVIF